MRGFVFLALVGLLFATSAIAREDNFGRPYTAGLSWSASPANDQWLGLRYWQVREGLPGIWIEGKTSSNWKLGNGGVNVRINDNWALVFGAGVSFDGNDPDTDDGINFHGGLLWRISKIVLHAGYDTRPGALAFGAGWALW